MVFVYEAILHDLGLTDRDDPFTNMIARTIVDAVTTDHERDPAIIKSRVQTVLGIRDLE